MSGVSWSWVLFGHNTVLNPFLHVGDRCQATLKKWSCQCCGVHFKQNHFKHFNFDSTKVGSNGGHSFQGKAVLFMVIV